MRRFHAQPASYPRVTCTHHRTPGRFSAREGSVHERQVPARTTANPRRCLLDRVARHRKSLRLACHPRPLGAEEWSRLAHPRRKPRASACPLATSLRTSRGDLRLAMPCMWHCATTLAACTATLRLPSLRIRGHRRERRQHAPIRHYPSRRVDQQTASHRTLRLRIPASPRPSHQGRTPQPRRRTNPHRTTSCTPKEFMINLRLEGIHHAQNKILASPPHTQTNKLGGQGRRPTTRLTPPRVVTLCWESVRFPPDSLAGHAVWLCPDRPTRVLCPPTLSK